MNHWYYYDLTGSRKGPVDWNTLQQLAVAGKIFSNTQIETPDGVKKTAAKVDGLHFNTAPQQPLQDNAQSIVQSIINSFRSTDYKEELLPITPDNMFVILRDKSFWVVLLLGVLPLSITSFQNLQIQLYGLLFFFAMLWGGVLRGLVLRSSDSVVLPVIAFFATGIIGVSALLTLYQYATPQFYLHLSDEEHNTFIRLFGFVFQVGLCEELCKIIPVIIYLAVKQKKASPMITLLIGVFSGLGFAAFENVGYAMQNMDASVGAMIETIHQLTQAKSEAEFHQTLQDGTLTTAVITHGAMVSAMLRSVSLVFAHSIWTGIFAYYLVCAMMTGKRWIVLVTLGLAVPMVLHGVYDWLCDLEPGFAALIIGISFILFFGYLTKIRQQLRRKEFA
ncbi:MAG: PrsW family intramembrane metalloprotease [Planctomycetaceae bacterium]|jgi:RsiW-degrading membrane proteinase PrsW (M82 family)|nr:PrsW family intramembrane metalloprotease [Planctomycetaceae bacterium]